jgi:hypothetical protein
MWWQYLAWGACGGLAVEVLEFSRAARRVGGRLWRVPGEPDLAALIASVLVRLLLSMLVAVATGLGHQVNGPAGAVAVGVAAPLLFELLAAQMVAAWPGIWVARLRRAAPFATAARFTGVARVGKALRGVRAGKPRPAPGETGQPPPGETEPGEAERDENELVVPEALIRVAGSPGEGASRNGSSNGKAGGTRKAGGTGKAGGDGG